MRLLEGRNVDTREDHQKKTSSVPCCDSQIPPLIPVKPSFLPHSDPLSDCRTHEVVREPQEMSVGNGGIIFTDVSADTGLGLRLIEAVLR